MRTGTIAALIYHWPSVAVMAAALAMPAHASPADRLIDFDIAAGPLATALTSYAVQARVQLVYSPSLVRGLVAPMLRGRFSAHGALERLLAGTDIAIRKVDTGVFVLDMPAARTTASADTAVYKDKARSDPEPTSAIRSDIVVTGSHIRGASPSAAPTRVLTRSEMRRNGYASVAQALQALPGNFGGMATEQSALSFADRSGNNLALASGVNLRGLGPDATLVLVNGRRVAGSGLVGDFADISSIPMSAVERVEVVTDGASALYGSDAVAGVVNILLKQDFYGFDSNVRTGSVTSGHARELQISQTVGTRWTGGSLLVSYEFEHRTGLRSADRSYARSADSRPFGGTDRRYSYSLPGNVLGFSATGELAPAFAIPPGQDGTALEPRDFLTGAVNLENYRLGSDLTPDQRRHSVYARAVQTLADGIDFAIEGRFSDRRYDSRTSGYATILSVTDANPWFVSPTGASSDLIGYAFTNELGATRTAGSARTLGLTGALNAEIGSGWQLSSYVAYAQQRDASRTDRIANEYMLMEALGSIPDDPLSAYSAAVDGYFNPYGNGTSNSAWILDAVSGYTDVRTRATVVTGDVLVDGPLFEIAGGSVKLAGGIDFRREDFTTRSSDFVFTPLPNTGEPARYDRDIWAGYGELNVPIIGAANARPGLQRLELTAAIRTERYGDFGRTTNPKLALRWIPFDGVAVRSTWGTSFRAPNLRELGQPESVSPALLGNSSGSSVVVLQRGGGNPGLAPERAHSWTAGIDVTPPSLSGLTIGITGFRTLFDRRIDQPALRGFSRALTDPSLSPFVRFVAPGSNAGDRAMVEELLAKANGVGGYPVESIAALVDTRYVNTGRVEVAGIDGDAAYAFDLGRHHINLGVSATYLARWREKVTPTATGIDQRNVAGRPVDLRVRSTAGWSRGDVDALLAINYVNRYRDLNAKRIRAWTTCVVRVAYSPDTGLFGGLTAAVIAQNVFDRAPPFFDSTVGAGYDGANADATGRFIALELSKRW